MAQAPKWAMDEMARVWGKWSASSVEPPVLRWRRRTGMGSSGTAYNDHSIVVRAGSKRLDQRLVLLHELAHRLMPKDHHGKAFWQMAWALYRDAGITKYALTREAGYKATATVVAARMGIRGAKTAAKMAAARRASNNDPRGACDMPAEIAVERGYRPGHTHYIGYGHTEYWPDGRKAYYSAKAKSAS